ncbi:hypothetical protein ACI8AF_03120 [Blastococcus sp. SYSU D00669]
MTAVRDLVGGYARTVLVPLIGLVAVPAGWTLGAAEGWPLASAAVAAVSAISAAWLHLQGWPRPLVHLVTWAAPAALLAPLAAIGQLSADGLTLWGPVAVVLAVCLATTGRAGKAA